MSDSGQKLRRLFRRYKGRHLLLLVSALIVANGLILKKNRSLMRTLSETVIRPIHRFLSQLNSLLPFSVAEVLLIAVAVFVLALFALLLFRLFFRKHRWESLYRFLITVFSVGTAVYAGFCLLWGVYYYGESFLEKSGLNNDKITVDQLETVTRYFADIASDYADAVNRDENGVYSADFGRILEVSDEVFQNTEAEYPCLSGPAICAKGILHSHLLSYTDFTGFFFPFTAEANVNTDVPSVYFASTVAHELSHQRGVATEQEANFVGVMAALNYGDVDYVYSSALLAYTHLSNALYAADYDSWLAIYQELNPLVLLDFEVEREYWKQFETPVETVSNTVYENFLYSYDQELGLKSYGACVDLLVNFYFEEAAKNY